MDDGTEYRFVRTPDPNYVSTVRGAEAWLERFSYAPSLAFDTETTGLSKTDARIRFFSLSDGQTRMAAPVRLLSHFQPLLEEPSIEKRFSNAKFDMHMAANHGIYMRGPLQDTVYMSWHFDENRIGRHGLKECAGEFLGLRMATFGSVFGKMKGPKKAEVDAVARFHDILESGDAKAAEMVLLGLQRADGDVKVLETLQKLSATDAEMELKKILAFARLHGLVPKGSGKYATVTELFALLGEEITKDNRREAEMVLAERREGLTAEARAVLFAHLRAQVRVDADPLELLQLMVADYASLDAWATFQLTDRLAEELMAIDEGDGHTIHQRYSELGSPFLQVLWNMERRGFRVNLARINAYSEQMKKDIARIERDMVAITKNLEINFNSPIQLRALFYKQDNAGHWHDPYGEPPKKFTDGGETGEKLPSLDAEILEGWSAKGHPLAAKLLEHRELTKLEGTYFSGLPTWCDRRERIHTDLKAHGTRTGRLSSGDPNLQNIPAHGDWGPIIRTLFIAGLWEDCDPSWCVESVRHIPVPHLPPDTPMTLIVADYDQLEVKVAAHVSQDPTLVSVLHAGKDVHSMTSSELTGIPYADFIAAKKAEFPTPEQEELVEIRAGNKGALFGIFYGIGAVKLGMQLKKPIVPVKMRNGHVRPTCPEAQAIIDGVFQVYPGLKDAIDRTHDECTEKLYVQTVTGRYRRLPDILSEERGISSQAERQSFNSRIQGSAADIAQSAMLKCEADPELRRLGARMLLQIHDELVFEVPDLPEYVEPAKARIKYLMEHPFDADLSVPLTVSLHAAKTWGDAK